MAGRLPAPPIFKVAPLPNVKIPPLVARLAVNVDKSSAPEEVETVKSPATLTLATNVALTVPPTVQLPLMVVILDWRTAVPLPLKVRW